MSADTVEGVLTHHVALILDNDEALYRWRQGLVRMAHDGAIAYLADPDNEGSPLTVEQLSRRDLADLLKDWCEELCGLEDDGGLPDLCRELVQTALHNVDWYALATGYLSEFA